MQHSYVLDLGFIVYTCHSKDIGPKYATKIMAAHPGQIVTKFQIVYFHKPGIKPLGQ